MYIIAAHTHTYIDTYIQYFGPAAAQGVKGLLWCIVSAPYSADTAEGSGGGSHGAVVYRGVPTSALHPP